MADPQPDITPYQRTLAERATGEVNDPVTGEKRLSGFPRRAVDLDTTYMINEWGQ